MRAHKLTNIINLVRSSILTACVVGHQAKIVRRYIRYIIYNFQGRRLKIVEIRCIPVYHYIFALIYVVYHYLRAKRASAEGGKYSVISGIHDNVYQLFACEQYNYIIAVNKNSSKKCANFRCNHFNERTNFMSIFIVRKIPLPASARHKGFSLYRLPVKALIYKIPLLIASAHVTVRPSAQVPIRYILYIPLHVRDLKRISEQTLARTFGFVLP